MTDVFFSLGFMMIRLFTQTLLVVSLICCVSCRARKVGTAEELVSIFADATEVVNENIEITSDLDFSSSSLSLPLGARTVGSCVPYSGTLKGHGHTISRLAINNKNSETTKFKNAGLFCKLQNATIDSLVVNSSCSFVGPSAGGLSVTVAGSVKLVNVTSKARVIGDENVGGFIGFIENLQEHTTLILDSCTNEGSISVNNVRVGGFVGAVKNNK